MPPDRLAILVCDAMYGQIEDIKNDVAYPRLQLVYNKLALSREQLPLEVYFEVELQACH